MSNILIFGRVKRHLILGNKFQCLFVKLDKTSDKITIISKRKERIVVAFTVLQFLVILAKIWSINARVTSLTENFLGIGILAISIAPFLLRCHTSADHVQLQFLNYLLLPKGGLQKLFKHRYFRLYFINT